MKISKELIEKYHAGRCTPEEQRAVEAWLFDDESTPEPTFPLPTGERKNTIRDEMWREIASVLPHHESPVIPLFARPVWRLAAAILLVSLVGAAGFYLQQRTAQPNIIVVNNVSETANEDLHENAYSLSIGPKSNVEVNTTAGRIEFCGAVLINPKRDVELTIRGICVRPDKATEKMTLKKGQPYIALNYSNATDANEVIVLPQGSLTGLPPLVQRHLSRQFDI